MKKLDTVVEKLMFEAEQAYKSSLAVNEQFIDKNSQSTVTLSKDELMKLVNQNIKTQQQLQQLIARNEHLVMQAEKSLNENEKKWYHKAWEFIKFIAAAPFKIFKFVQDYWLPILLVTIFLGYKFGILGPWLVQSIKFIMNKIKEWLENEKLSQDQIQDMVKGSGTGEGLFSDVIQQQTQKYKNIPGGFYDTGTF